MSGEQQQHSAALRQTGQILLGQALNVDHHQEHMGCPSETIQDCPYAACAGDNDTIYTHGQHPKLGPTGSVLSDARKPGAVAAHQTKPNMSKLVAKARVPSAGVVMRSKSRQNRHLGNIVYDVVCLCICLR